MKKIIIALFCPLLIACGNHESEQFAPPRFVSVESEVTGRAIITLRCTLSDSRVESCGFLYGEGDKPYRKVECGLSGQSFETSLDGIKDDVGYTWCAYATAGGVEIQSELKSFRTSLTDPLPIEDQAFKAWLAQNCDFDSDGVFSYSDASRVSSINITPTNKYNLQSLRGIEYMPALQDIYCSGEWSESESKALGTLSYVDVSCNPRLKKLFIDNNPGLNAEQGVLDLSNNPELEEMDLGFTGLNYPDISKNEALTYVRLSHLKGVKPNLSALHRVRHLCLEWPQDDEKIDLDVSKMPELECLIVHCSLSSVSNLSANPLLKTLWIGWNGLETLDVSENALLEDLQCQYNHLHTLDVSSNVRLKVLDCSPMDDGKGNNLLETLYIAKGQVIPSVTVDRNSDFVPDGTQIVEPPDFPPDNEIWYTTLSGKPLEIASGFCIGRSLVSNTYKDGRGVLKYNGPVSEFEEWGLYYNYDVESLILPSSVVETTYSCFRENMNLRRVEFAPGLVVLGDSSLHHSEGLQEVLLPDTVRSIEKDALSLAFSLEYIDLPPYLEKLGQSAFLNCPKLKSIVLPATMKSIGIYAFEYDESLTSIICLAVEPPVGGAEMFDNTSECPIYVPAASVEAYRSAPIWRNYAHRIKAIKE